MLYNPPLTQRAPAHEPHPAEALLGPGVLPLLAGPSPAVVDLVWESHKVGLGGSGMPCLCIHTAAAGPAALCPCWASLCPADMGFMPLLEHPGGAEGCTHAH